MPRVITLALVALAAAIAGCGGGSSSPPGNVTTAVSYLPAGTGSSYTFTFADWSQVEKGLGVTPSGLKSAKALSALFRPLNHLGELPAGESDYDLGIPGPHRLWGAPDVTWDASETATRGASAPPLALTGLRPQFDMGSIGKHLAGCGFEPKKVAGITVYEGSLPNMEKCAGPFGDQIPTFTNYGIDTATHTVVMSASPDIVTAAIKAHQANHTNPQVSDLLSQLNDQPTVTLGIGPGFCAQMSDPATFAGRSATPQAVEAVKKAYPPAQPYAAFGYGLTLTAHAETGRIVFEYSSESTAKPALTDREHRLQNGQSLATQEPYSQLVHVVSGHTSGKDVVLTIGQPAGHALALTAMFNHSDLGFARCG